MNYLKIMPMFFCLFLTWTVGCGGRSISNRRFDGGGGSGGDGAVLVDRGPADAPILPDSGATIPGTFKTLAPGSFVMGSPKGELCRLENEVRHTVTLTRRFQIMTTEVTQDMFLMVMGYAPSAFKACGGNCPVDSVTWSAGAYYANRLSKRANLDTCYLCDAKGGVASFPYNCRVNPNYSGAPNKTLYQCPGYRLPTEAEWEYAYRAKRTTALYNGNIKTCKADNLANAVGWYHDNASGKTHPAKKKAPNAWGLYDMAGNAWEWVNDWFVADLGNKKAVDPMGPKSGNGKVLKGGSYTVTAGGLRGAARQETPVDLSQNFLGFRVARTL